MAPCSSPAERSSQTLPPGHRPDRLGVVAALGQIFFEPLCHEPIALPVKEAKI